MSAGEAVPVLAENYTGGYTLYLAAKPGDRVWFTRSAYRHADAPIEAQVMAVTYRGGTDTVYTAVTYGGLLRKFWTDDIGRSVYLSREDAEEAKRHG